MPLSIKLPAAMIRLLMPADAPDYVALRREMLHDAPWSFGADPANDRGSDPAGVARSLAGENFAIAGGYAEGRLVSVAVADREKGAKRAHVAWIISVYTAPSARRRGLGRGVVRAAIDAARGWGGVAQVQLAVSSHAPEARALYESLGFVAWGLEPDAIRVGGKSYDETHMALRL